MPGSNRDLRGGVDLYSMSQPHTELTSVHIRWRIGFQHHSALLGSVVCIEAARLMCAVPHKDDHLQVLDKIFSSLHRAEVGQAGSNEQDASLPTRVRIPAPGAPASVQNGAPPLKRGPSSLVQSLFGLDVQVL